MAWVIARIWASVNDRWNGEPRCPLVPKLTRWVRSSTSGRHSKYSFSSRERSTSMSFGAVLPASGEIPICVVLPMHRARFRVPNLGGVLRNGAVARKLSGAGYVQNRLTHPSVRVCVELAEPLIGIEIRPEIRQKHVVVAMRNKASLLPEEWSDRTRIARE